MVTHWEGFEDPGVWNLFRGLKLPDVVQHKQIFGHATGAGGTGNGGPQHRVDAGSQFPGEEIGAQFRAQCEADTAGLRGAVTIG